MKEMFLYRERDAALERAEKAEARADRLEAENKRLRDTLNMIECETQCEDAAAWARATLAPRADTRTSLEREP